MSVTSCLIPAIWKSSIVIPIPKPGSDSSLGTSYLPISLLCRKQMVWRLSYFLQSKQPPTNTDWVLKVLGFTLDPKLTYSTHIHNISVQAHRPLHIIKALTATGWGKQKETLMATYKAVMRPAPECASSVWSPIASSTSINKLQIIHNAALRTATGCTQDTNIQHLHDETLTLPIHEHLQLHASQYKQKTSHPLHKHTTYFNTPRLKKHYF